MMGNVTSGPINQKGVIEETIEVSIRHPFRGTVLSLRLPAGTTALASNGNPLQKITVEWVSELPGLPEKWYLIETAYDFEPAGASFDPPIELTTGYDPQGLPEAVNEEDLGIAYYKRSSEEWIPLPSVVDTEAYTVTALIGHFTIFAIVGQALPPVVSDVSVYATDGVATISWMTDELSTSQVEYGITTSSLSPLDTALVTKHIVALTNLTPDTIYHFRVSSSDASGNLAISDEHTFTTLAPPAAANWWPFIGGIFGGVVLAGVLAWYFTWMRGGLLWRWWWSRKT
jgi:hypothetical protein